MQKAFVLAFAAFAAVHTALAAEARNADGFTLTVR